MATAHKLIRDNVVVFALVASEIWRSQLLVAVYFASITLPLCDHPVFFLSDQKDVSSMTFLCPVYYRDLLLKMIFPMHSDSVPWKIVNFITVVWFYNRYFKNASYFKYNKYFFFFFLLLHHPSQHFV